MYQVHCQRSSLVAGIVRSMMLNGDAKRHAFAYNIRCLSPMRTVCVIAELFGQLSEIGSRIARNPTSGCLRPR